jgi:hypothetical protein
LRGTGRTREQTSYRESQFLGNRAGEQFPVIDTVGARTRTTGRYPRDDSDGQRRGRRGHREKRDREAQRVPFVAVLRARN